MPVLCIKLIGFWDINSEYAGVTSWSRVTEEEWGVNGALRLRGSLLIPAEGDCLRGGADSGGGGGGGEAGLSTELLDILKSLRNLGSFRTYKTHISTRYTDEKINHYEMQAWV